MAAGVVWLTIPLVCPLSAQIGFLALPAQPVDGQGEGDDDVRGSSHCEMIEAYFEQVLMCLGLDGFCTADRAAIAGTHLCRREPPDKVSEPRDKVSERVGQCLPRKRTL